MSNPGVPIYADPKCCQVREGVRGIILETRRNPGNAFVSFRIFPTTRMHFKKGKLVAWEWDLSKVWGESWYRAPETNEIRYAWASSGEFAGRDLDNL